MHHVVRPLTSADCSEFARLQAEARLALEEQRGGPEHLRERPAVLDPSELLQRADRLVLVATIDDVPVGYLELAVEPGGIAEVLQVYVHPAARELGFGAEMLEVAEQHALANGCRAIEGTALPGDRETKNLYERAGIKARRITVSKRLDA